MLTRPVVIALALAGAACSVAAGTLRKQAGREAWAARLDLAGYVLMGISMLCFIIAGWRGTES